MRERRAQIVRDAVACTLHFVHETFDFRKHMVHQMREHIHFIASADR